MTTETRSLYSQLPAIDRLLRDSSFLSLRDTYGHTRVVELLRQMLDEAREVIRDSQTLPAWCENWAQEVDARLTKEAQSALRPVINLTGTVLHTNLGRALQAEAAVEAVAQAMRSPVTLEYDLDDAGRGHRDRALAQLLCRITGAEDACIVNNNAAAVLLMLAATASGKEVVVSRGELVEIGGAFRIPDVMRQAGCTLHEVGTTNRTHAND
ncbi:TPA: L-seryl-tRNA(Sec) selenium transferase, partial [Escherichia coli]